MLQLYKNNVITEATQQQASVRQMELDFYTNNYWIWGTTATVMAGWVFTQLTNSVPEGTDPRLEMAYLLCTAVSLGLDLCIITWTTLCCIWGPGLALRGRRGMQDFHKAVDFLRDQQMEIYRCFVMSVVTYFISSCLIVWVYPSRTQVNLACMAVMGAFLVLVIYHQCRLEMELGRFSGVETEVEGVIEGLRGFEQVQDMDHRLSQSYPGDSAALWSQDLPGLSKAPPSRNRGW